MSFSLTWLPSVLRGAGLKVVEQPGWRDRGQGDIGKIQLVICHHTAEKVDADLHPDLEILTEGREGLRGCLAQLGLGQDGTYYIIAAGKAWHAGAGEWKGVTEGNSHAIGIEAENNGIDEVWPDIQMDAYARGCAAIAKFCGFGPGMVIGHKEWAKPAGRKIDPNFDMNEFRKRVAAAMTTPVMPSVAVSKPAPAVDLAAMRALAAMVVAAANEIEMLRAKVPK